MKKQYDLIIIGGGAVGCAIAYTLSRYHLSIALLERNPDVAMGTSSKNSAVVHAGFNNRPGSLMAELCVAGNKRFEDICRTLDVPYRKTGKLVVALDESDLPTIDEILVQGAKNGCIGLSKMNKAEMNAMEPFAGGIAALSSANTAVINPFLYTIHLAEAAMQNGIEIYLNNEVTAIQQHGGGFAVTAGTNTFECDIIINSAGLYADKVAAMAGDTRYRIYPNRGEYFILDKQASELVSRPIYPAPRKGVGGLGVHLTTTIDGNMLIGPSAEYVGNCEDYQTTKKTFEQLWSEATSLLPQLSRNMIIGAYTGMRAKVVPQGGGNFGDFVIEKSSVNPNIINLVGIESPGLTASIPIAERVADMLKTRHSLTEKSNWKAEYKGNPIFRDLTDEKKDALIKENSAYGEIICRCEQVTKAEVLNALDNPLGVKTLVSIKNRARATMGRCQGGYCLQRIVELLMKEYGCSPDEISYRFPGDKPFPGYMK